MISHEDAAAAAQTITDCKTLLASEAFARVIQTELQERLTFTLTAGRDVAKSPRRRAEFHQASHILEELLTVRETKLAAAEATLKEWHEQPRTGERYV